MTTDPAIVKAGENMKPGISTRKPIRISANPRLLLLRIFNPERHQIHESVAFTPTLENGLAILVGLDRVMK